MSSNATRNSSSVNRGRKKNPTDLAAKGQGSNPSATDRPDDHESAQSGQFGPITAPETKDLATLQSLLEKNFFPNKDDDSAENNETAPILDPETNVGAANWKSRSIKSLIGLAGHRGWLRAGFTDVPGLQR